MKISTLTRYLALNIYSAVGIVTLALLALFFFFNFLGELGNYNLLQTLIVVLMNLPTSFYDVFPITTMIGTLYGLSQLARRSEIVAMRTSGLSLMGILRTITLIGAPLVALHITFGEVLMPYFGNKVVDYKQLVLKKSIAGGANLWVRDGQTYIGIRRVQYPARLEGVHIFELDKENRLLTIQTAESGEYVAPSQWMLHQVTKVDFNPEQTTYSNTRQYDQLSWSVHFSPDILKVLRVVPSQMTMPQLSAYVNYLRENHLNSNRYQVAMWRKLLFPFNIWILMLLVLPFVLPAGLTRAGRFLAMRAMFLGIAFYTVDSLFASVVASNNWPLFMVVIPSIVAMVGVFFWLRLRV